MKRRVVITGLGLISPLGLTIEDNWTSLIKGTSGLDFITSFDCSSWKIKVAGEVKNFDARILPCERKYIKLMNRDAQLAVAATDAALKDAGLNQNTMDTSAVGIAFGAYGVQYTLNDVYIWLKESEGIQSLNPIWNLTILPNMSLCHIANVHNIRGPNISFCALTTSGAQAVGEAYKSIRDGEAEVYIAGGCSSLNLSYLFSLYASGFLSQEAHNPQAACRPFDRERSGFVMSEGAAVVILEELSHARRRGATIYAEVIGYAATFNGSGCLFAHTSIEPAVEGVVRCFTQVLNDAGINPPDIDYLNAEGNATVVCDKVETEAIKRVFGEYAPHLPISATKSTMGHLLCASGPAELIVGTLAIQEGIIPPTINYEHPDPECNLDYTPNTSRKRKLSTVLSHTMGLSGEEVALIIRKLSD